MPLVPPARLSPSRISTFTNCALAFRFAEIDRIPQPPSLPATRGTLVHAALERLLRRPAGTRSRDAAAADLDGALAAMADDPELTGLDLGAAGLAQLHTDAASLVDRYFQLEDPDTIEPLGLELRLEFALDGVDLVGVIDRLERDPHGGLVVTDYKTGRAPGAAFEQGRLEGVQFYALLCERLYGERPAKVQLLYLADPVAIVATPSEQSTRAQERKVRAVWQAIETACARDSFQPRTSKLCDWCAFQAWCPSFGGDPALAPRAAAAGPPTGEPTDVL